MLTFQIERWADAWHVLEPLTPDHWQEMALDKDLIKIDMDAERYQKLDEQGMIHLTTARDDGHLVGYVICFVMTHLHYRGAGLMALADMYWLRPEYRRGTAAVELFRTMEQSLKERGVVRAHMSCKVHQDHSALFRYLGWELTDYTFGKILCR